MECEKERNTKKCGCTYTSCSRRGACCECVAYHIKKDEVPGCFFSKEAERIYDRSLDFFLKSKGYIRP